MLDLKLVVEYNSHRVYSVADAVAQQVELESHSEDTIYRMQREIGELTAMIGRLVEELNRNTLNADAVINILGGGYRWEQFGDGSQ